MNGWPEPTTAAPDYELTPSGETYREDCWRQLAAAMFPEVELKVPATFVRVPVSWKNSGGELLSMLEPGFLRAISKNQPRSPMGAACLAELTRRARVHGEHGGEYMEG